MTKKIQIFFLILFLNGCGYEPILTSKKYDFKFNDIFLEGNADINKIIQNNLLDKSTSNSKKKYDLNLFSEKFKEIVSSNEKGDVTVYRMKIFIKYVLKDNEKTILGNEIKKQITYNNINDKFELLEYEKNIIKTLSESISSEIVVSITTINSDL